MAWSVIKRVDGIRGYWMQERTITKGKPNLGYPEARLVVWASSQSAANGAKWEATIDGDDAFVTAWVDSFAAGRAKAEAEAKRAGFVIHDDDSTG